jgi:hypothetical protein
VHNGDKASATEQEARLKVNDRAKGREEGQTQVEAKGHERSNSKRLMIRET